MNTMSISRRKFAQLLGTGARSLPLSGQRLLLLLLSPPQDRLSASVRIKRGGSVNTMALCVGNREPIKSQMAAAP